jgi:DNA-binding XRE family transcriptional regulator
MPTSNTNWKLLKDEKVVAQLGKELRRMRLSKNMSQADVAKHAGLDRTTVVKLEAGRAATLLTVVQILRAMDRASMCWTASTKRTATSRPTKWWSNKRSI